MSSKETKDPAVLAPPAAPEPLDYNLADYNYDISPEDVAAPRIRLLQPTRRDNRFDNVPSGHWVSLVTGEDLGERIHVVVVGSQSSRARFAPIDQGGDLLCRAPDGRNGIGDPGGPCNVCPFAEWHGKTPPECAQAFNYFVLAANPDGTVEIPEVPVPSILRLSRSAMGEAKRWNWYLRSHKPPFGIVYEVASVKTRAPKGAEYYAPRVRIAARVTDPATLRGLDAIAKEIRNVAIRALSEDPEEAEHDAADETPF